MRYLDDVCVKLKLIHNHIPVYVRNKRLEKKIEKYMVDLLRDRGVVRKMGASLSKSWII
jgi:hypothetical protein